MKKSPAPVAVAASERESSHAAAASKSKKKVRFFRGKSPAPPKRADHGGLDQGALLRKLSALDEAEEEVQKARRKILQAAAVCNDEEDEEDYSDSVSRNGSSRSAKSRSPESSSTSPLSQTRGHHQQEQSTARRHGIAVPRTTRPGRGGSVGTAILTSTSARAGPQQKTRRAGASYGSPALPVGAGGKNIEQKSERIRAAPRSRKMTDTRKRKAGMIKGSVSEDENADSSTVPVLDLLNQGRDEGDEHEHDRSCRFFNIDDSPRTRKMRESEDPIGSWFDDEVPAGGGSHEYTGPDQGEGAHIKSSRRKKPASSSLAKSALRVRSPPAPPREDQHEEDPMSTPDRTSSRHKSSAAAAVRSGSSNRAGTPIAGRAGATPPPRPNTIQQTGYNASDEGSDCSDCSSQCTEVSMHLLDAYSSEEEEPCGEPGCRSGRTSSAASNSSLGSLYQCETPNSLGSLYGSNSPSEAGDGENDDDDGYGQKKLLDDSENTHVLNLENLAAHNASLNAVQADVMKDMAFLPRSLKISSMVRNSAAGEGGVGGAGGASGELQGAVVDVGEEALMNEKDVIQQIPASPVMNHQVLTHTSTSSSSTTCATSSSQVSGRHKISTSGVRLLSSREEQSGILLEGGLGLEDGENLRKRETVDGVGAEAPFLFYQEPPDGTDFDRQAQEQLLYGENHEILASGEPTPLDENGLPILLRKKREENSTFTTTSKLILEPEVWYAPDVTLVAQSPLPASSTSFANDMITGKDQVFGVENENEMQKESMLENDASLAEPEGEKTDMSADAEGEKVEPELVTCDGSSSAACSSTSAAAAFPSVTKSVVIESTSTPTSEGGSSTLVSSSKNTVSSSGNNAGGIGWSASTGAQEPDQLQDETGSRTDEHTAASSSSIESYRTCNEDDYTTEPNLFVANSNSESPADESCEKLSTPGEEQEHTVADEKGRKSTVDWSDLCAGPNGLLALAAKTSMPSPDQDAVTPEAMTKPVGPENKKGLLSSLFRSA